MRILATVLLTIGLGASAALPAQTRDDNWNRCRDNDPDLSIGGCSALIQSGTETIENLSTAFYNRGNAHRHKLELDGAIQDYDRALELNPGNANAFDNRGLAYTLKGDYVHAISDFDDALRFNPGNVTALANRGAAYTRTGDFRRAISDYDQALGINPRNANALNSRGRTYFYLGRFAAARQDFAAAGKLNPRDPYSALWSYLASGRAGHDGRNELEKNAKQINMTAWPGQVISLYLGKATQEMVLSAANDPDAKKALDWHCEAYFYLGEDALVGGRRSEAKCLFQQSINTGATSFAEYAGAQAELKLLQNM
jgi:lipoprotein NlpI